MVSPTLFTLELDSRAAHWSHMSPQLRTIPCVGIIITRLAASSYHHLSISGSIVVLFVSIPLHIYIFLFYWPYPPHNDDDHHHHYDDADHCGNDDDRDPDQHRRISWEANKGLPCRAGWSHMMSSQSDTETRIGVFISITFCRLIHIGIIFIILMLALAIFTVSLGRF